MFRIGTFSKLAQVSVRTLRFYEERGLIIPAFVDHASGYRYYTLDQLPRLQRVLALRDLGLSLDEIARLVRRPLSAERLRVLLAQKQRELCARVEEEQARLRRVEARLRQIELEGIMPDYEVIVKRVEPLLVASVRTVIPDREQIAPTLDRLFDEVSGHVRRSGGKAAGPALDLWYDPKQVEQDMNVEAAVPIAQPIPETDRVRVQRLPGVEMMASTTHHGPFDGLRTALEAVVRWAGENGYGLASPFREVYLQYERDGDPNDYVTEIQYPLTKA